MPNASSVNTPLVFKGARHQGCGAARVGQATRSAFAFIATALVRLAIEYSSTDSSAPNLINIKVEGQGGHHILQPILGAHCPVR